MAEDCRRHDIGDEVWSITETSHARQYIHTQTERIGQAGHGRTKGGINCKIHLAVNIMNA